MLVFRPPATAQALLLADTRFVLEKQADTFVGMSCGGRRQGITQAFF